MALTRVVTNMTGNNLDHARRRMIPVSRHWMECTEPDGVTRYFYNISTGESCWVEPEEVRRTVRSLEQLSEMAQQEVSRREIMGVDPSAWVERRDASNRVYYFNTVTRATVWDMPSDLRELREISENTSSNAQTTAPNDSLSEATLNREREFVRMLEERGVGVADTWEDILKDIYNHPAYKALPCLADRKACFNGYVDELKRLQKQSKSKNPRDDFIDCLQSVKMSTSTRYEDIEEKLRRFDCYHRLSSRERHDLFQKHMGDLKRQFRDSLLLEFTEYLYCQRFEFGSVGWLEVKDKLASRFPSLSRLDILAGWENYILDCEERTIRQAHEEHWNRQQSERSAVSAYTRRLKTMVRDKQIQLTSRFEDVLTTLQPTEEYQRLSELKQAAPKALFLLAIDELEEGFEKDRQFMLSLSFRNIPSDQHIAILSSVIDPVHVELVFGRNWRSAIKMPTPLSSVRPPETEPVLDKENSDRANTGADSTIASSTEAKKDGLRPQIELYKHLLKRFSPPITLRSRFSDYEPLLARHGEYQLLPDQIRRDYFEKYQVYLKRKADELPASGANVKQMKHHNV